TFGAEMKSSRSIAAGDFQLSLEAGVVDRDEVIRWADAILTESEYDDDLAEISLASGKSDKDLEAILAKIAGTDTNWHGFRRMLGRMHGALLRAPERLPEFTRFLERLWIRHDYTLPDDLGFIVGLEDDYLLAADGQFGSIEEVRRQLLEELSRFAQSKTEQGGDGDA
ncbi:hypothetical protein ACFQY0_21340, partial [Haloferula chungangensis]